MSHVFAFVAPLDFDFSAFKVFSLLRLGCRVAEVKVLLHFKCYFPLNAIRLHGLTAKVACGCVKVRKKLRFRSDNK